MRKQGKSTSFYMSEKGMLLLDSLAASFGISKSAVLEILIRDRAKREKINESST